MEFGVIYLKNDIFICGLSQRLTKSKVGETGRKTEKTTHTGRSFKYPRTGERFKIATGELSKNGGQKMKNIELCKKLENEGNGFTIDYSLEKDGKKVYLSYDTYDLKDGIKSKNLNTEDYLNINDMDIKQFKLGDIILPLRKWLNKRCDEYHEREQDFSDETVQVGFINYDGETYNYEISISH